MRLVLSFEYLTFKFRIQPGNDWCKVDTELIQSPSFPSLQGELPFPCKVDCHIMGDESIEMRELKNLANCFAELYAGVKNFEKPHFMESVISIDLSAPFYHKQCFVQNGERKTEYIYNKPSMDFKINITAPYTGGSMKNYITLCLDSVQTEYFYTYIKLILGIVSEDDKTVLEMLSNGILTDD